MNLTRFVTRTLTLAAIGSSLWAGRAMATETTPEVEAARGDVQRTLGFVPRFVKALPDEALPGLWGELKGLQLNPATALSPKHKELIGLAVASQIPCRYCILAHTEFARLNGASEREIGEAVSMGAITRHWSTYLNGLQLDDNRFRSEISQIVEGAKKASAAGAKPARSVAVVDAASAQEDMRNTLGVAPEFLRRFPAEGLPGAWTEFKTVQLNPNTALPGKVKELIGLAVAAQVPCHYCTFAHTEFARLNGASDREIAEAVGMAALTRNLSTMLNGMQVDEVAFRQDIDKLVAGAKAGAKKAAATASATPATRKGRTATH